MMHLNQPLAVLPGHQGNIVGARPAPPSLPARRVGGGSVSSSASSRRRGVPRISCSATEEIAGAVTAATVEKMLTVRATVEASPAIGRMYATRGFDDIGDLLGKSLLLELVSSEVDPSE
jgi:lipoxygenase